MWSWPSREETVGNLLGLVLTAIWLTLTGFKMAEFISEPTATKTYWNRTDYLPPFTLCPALRTTSLSSGNEPDRQNDTLLQLFHDLSLSPEEMLLHVNSPKENLSKFTVNDGYDCVDFKTSVDYSAGGLCITSKGISLSSLNLVLLPNPMHQFDLEDALTYDLVFHGHLDFYGDVYLADTTYYLSSAQRGLRVIVTTDRQIQENLRRDPCIDDPKYSRRLCEHHCFLEWLNCSMHSDAETDTPRCMASDAEWYDEEEPLLTFMHAADGQNACRCPKPCVTDLISVSIQPDFYIEQNNFTYVQIAPAKTMKVLHIYLNYTFSDLMADVGGFLGLFLGSSILSTCRLLPKLARWVSKKWHGRRSRASGGRSRRERKITVTPYPAENLSSQREKALFQNTSRASWLVY